MVWWRLARNGPMIQRCTRRLGRRNGLKSTVFNLLAENGRGAPLRPRGGSWWRWSDRAVGGSGQCLGQADRQRGPVRSVRREAGSLHRPSARAGGLAGLCGRASGGPVAWAGPVFRPPCQVLTRGLRGGTLRQPTEESDVWVKRISFHRPGGSRAPAPCPCRSEASTNLPEPRTGQSGAELSNG